MKLLFNLVFLFIFVFFFNYTGSVAEELKATYKINLKGIKIGDLTWSLIFENGVYQTNIELESGGLLSPIYKFEGDYTSKGMKNNNLFVSKFYKHRWSTNKKTREVVINFLELGIKVNQNPIEKENSRILLDELVGFSDPIASFLNLLLENKSSKTVDGRRTYTMLVEDQMSEKNITIYIDDFNNIWADHKRNDLKKINFIKNEYSFFPTLIEIHFKNNIFKAFRY